MFLFTMRHSTLFLIISTLAYANPNKEANSIIDSASEGRKVISEQPLDSIPNRKEEQYREAVILNWIHHYQALNARGAEFVGKKADLITDITPEQVKQEEQKELAKELVIVKGFCFIAEEINVGKQPAALRANCQTNAGAITLFANLVNVNEKASLIVDPKYIERNGIRFNIESSIVTNEERTSYNIATFVNDRKLAEIGWGAVSVGSDEFKSASNEYLKALERSKQKQEISYANVGDSNGNVYPLPTNTTNTEKPDPLDYLVKSAINMTASVAKNTADVFKKDLPYLYQVLPDTKIWIDLKVNKQGELAK